MQSLKKRLKRGLGLPVSPSPDRPRPGFEYGPDGRKRRIIARSPPQPTPEEIEYGREIIRLEREEKEAVDKIIRQINDNFGIEVDEYDPTIRWTISKIISIHGLTNVTIEKIKSCKPLLYAISNALVIGSRATGTGIKNIAAVLVPAATELTKKLASLAGQGLVMGASLAGQGLAMGASMAMNSLNRGRDFLLSSQRTEQQGIARSVSPPRSRMSQVIEVAYTTDLSVLDFVKTALSGLYRVLSQIFQSISSIVSPCLGAAFDKLCSLITTEQAVGDAVNQVVPEGPNLECSICMDNAIVGQGAVVTSCNHRFHKNCIEEWFRRSGNRSCPYCRTSVTNLSQPQYGGLKKYRSKSRSKSKSKSKLRRYVSKPQKSRKARKRVRHASSRRR
jgi:hypothetical protein